MDDLPDVEDEEGGEAYEQWRVRELTRLRRERRKEKAAEAEIREKERRRRMTDKEIMEEDREKNELLRTTAPLQKTAFFADLADEKGLLARRAVKGQEEVNEAERRRRFEAEKRRKSKKGMLFGSAEDA